LTRHAIALKIAVNL